MGDGVCLGVGCLWGVCVGLCVGVCLGCGACGVCVRVLGRV